MKKSLSMLAVSAALLGSAGIAQAGTEVGRWTAGAGVMYTLTDSTRNVDDNYGFTYEFGYGLNENWDVTVNLFSGNHDDLAPGANWDREIKGLTFDFDRVFHRGERVSPFLLIGAGLLDQHRPDPVNPLNHQDKEVAVKLGGGLLADITDLGGTKLQFKATAVARSSIGRKIVDFAGTAGLQVAFGGK
jgi:hypothetical protein